MFLNIIFMVIALSVDIFVSCAAYGANQVFLSGKQIAVMNVICSLCMGSALIFGSLVDSWIPEKFTKNICFFSLLFLGSMKLADAGIRRYLRNHRNLHGEVSFGFSQVHFIVNIYSDPMEADRDHNHSLSWKEVLVLSLAMSIDCGLTGAMAAFMKLSAWITMLSLFLTGEIAAYAGIWLGKRISEKCPKDLSWLSGIIFIVMAVIKQ